MTALSFAAALIFPISRYVVRHFMLLDVMYDIGMLESVNLEAPYWATELMEEIKVNDRYLIGYNDFCLADVKVLVFNKDLMKQYNLRGTFLLQYDALLDPVYVDLMKSLDPEQFEIGVWFETVQPQVEKVGLQWTGRFPWDWHPHCGFSVGYTKEQREKLVDVLFEEFKSIFGYYPRVFGSWFYDTHTVRYILENSAPVLLRKVTFEGLTVTNPTDDFIDANGLGYPLKDQPAPEYDPDNEKILGGYRYIYGTDIKIDGNGQPVLATSHMFNFSEKFLKEYLPHTIELGRSFVAPEYQSRQAGVKALFALDNLWDGLCALVIERPGMKYFFGKMTMYPEYNREARDLIQHFLFKHFEDKEKLVTPMDPLVIETPAEKMDAILTEKEFKDDYKLLNAEVRRLGVNIPPLVNSYMSLSPTMKTFGGGINHEFSEAEETCILIAFDEIYEAKKARHIDSFIAEKVRRIGQRFPLFVENMGEELTDMIARKRARIQFKLAEKQKRREARKQALNK